MAKRKKKQSKKGAIGGVITAVCLIGVILLLTVGSDGDFVANLEDIWNNTASNAGSPVQTNPDAESLADIENHKNDLILYAIDTGNSDSLLLHTPDGYSMLVDAADSDDFDKISGTLTAFGVQTLDVAVATHPDADHIGSMDKVLQQFDPATFYLPDFTKDTATFKRMLDAAEQSDASLVFTHTPLEFMLGENVHVQVLSPPPQPDFSGANNHSIVLLVTYEETKLLLTGDAEKEALTAMLTAYGTQIDADVLKVGHHGSHTSTTQELLSAVTPDLGIITCGTDNDYGHPHTETLDLLTQNNVLTLRTDQNGDIAVYMDGTSVSYATAA